MVILIFSFLPTIIIPWDLKIILVFYFFSKANLKLRDKYQHKKRLK